ncbi:hypothetical protein GOV13_00705 [Candidatus Pacearchaeota archaeon]|nr:hypothetical protein [Candidatus Pacearchaeota archaeon]
MDNKGELTTQQIVGLIVLIVSFSVILLLIFRLDLGETTNKEICHNSVILKSRSSVGGEIDCRTNYVCISGGGDCQGINPTAEVEIDLGGTKEEIKNRTMKAIADEMVECWWMFGEGKVNYGGVLDKYKERTLWNNYHCAVCSIVKFGDDMEIDKITYKEFYEYLLETKKDKTQTYLDYLYDAPNMTYVEAKIARTELDLVGGVISTKEKYAIVTGMKQGYYINPYFVKSNEITNQTECKVFDITKA